MARADIMQTAYALRREGVEIISSKDGRFPSFIILKPNEKLKKSAVKLVENINGTRRERYVARQGNCSLYWW